MGEGLGVRALFHWKFMAPNARHIENRELVIGWTEGIDADGLYLSNHRACISQR